MVLKKFNTNNGTVSITQTGKKCWSLLMTPIFSKARHCKDYSSRHCEERSDAAIQTPAFSQSVTLNKIRHSELVSESLTDYKETLKQVQGDRRVAFSLVELLMALLVASLLMTALAPVMTKKFREDISVSSVGNGVKSDYSRTFYDDFEWAVPAGVNRINVTSIGGGGGGGGATYGYKKIMSTENKWVVPEGVTKLRVFMVGAGGGGASGGLDVNYAKLRGRDDGEVYADFLTPGETSFTMTNRTTPALDSKCIASGTTKWLTDLTQSEILKRDNVLSEYAPNAAIQSKVTACGAGGGGGGAYIYAGCRLGGGGGSGGYAKNLVVDNMPNTIYVKIPGGGGGANTGYGQAGGYASGGGGAYR